MRRYTTAERKRRQQSFPSEKTEDFTHFCLLPKKLVESARFVKTKQKEAECPVHQ